MSSRENAEVVMQILHAIEERRFERVAALYHPQVEFHWPPGLPYSGDFAGETLAQMNEQFGATWLPLQPDEATRRMNPRVVAANDAGDVVIHYVWKGLDADGRRFATETLGHYQVRDGKLARAQMFYYDLLGLRAFLDGARVAGLR